MKNTEMLEQFAKKLIHTYFIDHDTVTVLSYTCKEMTWVGMESTENFLDYQAFKTTLEKNNLIFSQYQLSNEQYHVKNITPLLHQVYCVVELQKKQQTASLQNFILHLTMLIQEKNHTHFLYSLHVSKDNFNTTQNKSELSQDISNKELQKHIQQKTLELEEKNKDLQRFTENLPGELFRCIYDENLTLTHMSNGFLSMIGYTKEEVTKKLHNSFRKLIDSRDIDEVNKDIVQQMKIDSSITLEYRIVHKDGHAIWVMDKRQLIVEDGIASFYCILVDTSDRKEAQENLRISLERHNIISDQANDIIFEWNIKNDTFTFSQNWKKKFGYEPSHTIKSNEITTKSHFYHEDAIAFYNLLMDVKKGVPYMEKEVRIQKIDGTYIWCNSRITTQFDENGKPISAVGVFIDIDNIKRASEKLIEKAERDPLTKLYNKTTVQNLIEDSLNTNKQHALMIIDVDNFKYINDSMGHLFGDAFLCEVAKHIQESVGKDDIVGRIGGDEFIVFIKNITSLKNVQNRAKKIIDVFHNIEIKEVAQQHISSSIGVALFPSHGTNFIQLYKNADYTLYEAKKSGKNKFLICDDAVINDAKFSLSASGHSEINENIESNVNNDQDFSLNMMTEYVFKILYQSMDIEVAIASIIQIIGKKFDVSRVYIFENSEDNEYCSNTFEWCNEGIPPEKELLQKVSYKEHLGNTYVANFNESDIFYCRDISELPKAQYDILAPQGIKSLLQCAIRDGNRLRGFVGFDECRDNRFWTQTQINSLSFIAALISTFLLKERVQKRLEESAHGLQAILDNQNSWIYVINKQDYTMYYINQKTASFVPSARPGMYCFKAFFDKETPCEDCPVKAYKKHNESIGIEIYNPVLGVWSASNAGEIIWNGKPAYLISCYDITKYKK